MRTQGALPDSCAGFTYLTASIPPCFRPDSPSIQSDAIHSIELRCVGQDHPVADIQSFQNLNVGDGTAPQFDLRAHGLFAALDIFEERDHVLFLAERRALNIEHVFQSLDLNRAVDAHIRTRAFGRFAVERDVYGQGSLRGSGGHAHDMSFDDPEVAQVDLDTLPKGDVSCLGFGD